MYQLSQLNAVIENDWIFIHIFSYFSLFLSLIDLFLIAWLEIFDTKVFIANSYKIIGCL